jgi:hypothetical protein
MRRRPAVFGVDQFSGRGEARRRRATVATFCGVGGPKTAESGNPQQKGQHLARDDLGADAEVRHAVDLEVLDEAEAAALVLLDP